MAPAAADEEAVEPDAGSLSKILERGKWRTSHSKPAIVTPWATDEARRATGNEAEDRKTRKDKQGKAQISSPFVLKDNDFASGDLLLSFFTPIIIECRVKPL